MQSSPQPTPAKPPLCAMLATIKQSSRRCPSASPQTQQISNPTAICHRRALPPKLRAWTIVWKISRSLTGLPLFTSSKRPLSRWLPSSPTAKPPTLLSNLAPESPRLVVCSKCSEQLVVPTCAIDKPLDTQSSGTLWQRSTVPTLAKIKSWISPWPPHICWATKRQSRHSTIRSASVCSQKSQRTPPCD